MMTPLFLAAALSAGAAQLPDSASAPANAPADDGSTETLAIARDRHQRMTIPVTIDGEGPFDFMVDTGAQATVVTGKLNDKLRFRSLGRKMLVGMGSSAEVELVAVNGLEFAARVFDNIEAPLLDHNDLGADGIIGLDSLQDMRVLIDFRGNEMRVADSALMGSNRGFEIVVRARRKRGRLIITSAKIDGVTTAVIVDTGAQYSIGNRALERRLRARHNGDVTAVDVLGSAFTANTHLTRKLTMGRASLSNVVLTFADGPAFAAIGLAERPAMVLGMRELRAFDRVAIDFAERKVLFDLPRDALRPRGGSRIPRFD